MELLWVNDTDAEETIPSICLSRPEKDALRIECTGLNKHVRHRLAWRPPSADNRITPENAARTSDLAIIFIRDDSGAESRDRKTLALNPDRERLIANVAKANPNTIVVLGSSTPLLLGKVSQQARALLNVWIAGQCEAQAIVDILFGRVNPSGKTPVTFFADERQLPALDDYNIKNGRSYQYFREDVLYPFGFGLSYSAYRYSRPQLQQATLSRWNAETHRWEIRPSKYTVSVVPHSGAENAISFTVLPVCDERRVVEDERIGKTDYLLKILPGADCRQKRNVSSKDCREQR